MSDLKSNIDVSSSAGDPTRKKIRGTARPIINLPVPGIKKEKDTKNGKEEVAEPSAMSQEKFARIVFDVGNRLPKSRLKDVRFLCYGKTSDIHKLEEAKDAIEIFTDMETFGTLEKHNLGLIAELLHRIGMMKAKREVFEGTGITWSMDEGRSYLDPFRCLLHAVSQQLLKQKLSDLVKYCSLRDVEIEEETDDFLDFFASLEDQEEIAADNIGLLRDFSDNVLKNKRVKDYIEKYEKEMRERGSPVLTMTEEEAKKLLTRSIEGKASLKNFYGSYDSIAKGEAGNDDELMDVDQGETSKASLKDNKPTASYQKKSLITPSMIQASCSLKLSEKEDEKLAEKSSESVKSPGDGESSQEPMDESPPAGSLQSTDILPDGATYRDVEDDATEYFTMLDDHQRSLKIPCYAMDASPKGVCLILSNEHFDRQPGQKEPSDRDGSEKDVESLMKVFTGLDFEVHTKKDLTADEMCKELKKWRDFNHRPFNAFICCILSHGNRGIIFGKDGKVVELCKMIGYFNGQNCRSLINKPKIFIVQACQGDSWQTVTTDRTPQSPTEGPAVGMGSGMKTLPKEVDILLILSTIPGYKSARSSEQGSWFIKALTHILGKFPDAEMQSIMTILNQELAKATKVKKEGRIISQTALPSHTLRKLLFLKHASHIQLRGDRGEE